MEDEIAREYGWRLRLYHRQDLIGELGGLIFMDKWSIGVIVCTLDTRGAHRVHILNGTEEKLNMAGSAS